MWINGVPVMGTNAKVNELYQMSDADRKKISEPGDITINTISRIGDGIISGKAALQPGRRYGRGVRV